jgi:hypothetical protein
MKQILSLTVSLMLAMPVIAGQSSSQGAEQAPVAGEAGSRFVLEDGTPIKLVLGETISSADATVGQTIPFEVVEDVLVDGIVVVPKGGPAWATVTAAEPKKRLGRGGKLDLNIDKVRLVDGSKTLLSAVKNTKGGGHTGAMTGAIVATSLIVWPAAPFFLFMHGKDITIPKGTAITAFVQGDDVLDRSKFVRQAQVSAPVVPQQEPVAQPQPSVAQIRAMQIQSVSTEPSVAEAARQNRAAKAQQQQNQSQQAQQQNPNQ